MIKNYYEILGIPSDSNLDAIKSAYRRRAMACHPDRGGRHSEMLEINEAFEILSNQITRDEYDRACRDRLDVVSNLAVIEKAHRARQQAEVYPRRWADFEKWMDSVTTDFKRAEYAQSNGMPTAGSSITGWLFIGVGFLGGFGLYNVFGLGDHPGYFSRLLLFALVGGGAWLGRLVHEATAVAISSPNSTNRQQSKSEESSWPRSR